MSSHKKRRELNRATDEHTHARIRAELAAALAACKAKDEAIAECLEHWVPPSSEAQIKQALAIKPDDSALKAWLGEPVWVSSEDLKLVEEYGYKMLMVDDAKRGMADTPLYSPKGLK